MTASHLLVGTYTEHLPHVNGTAQGILAGTIESGFETAAAVINPSWLTATSDGGTVYATSETTDFEGFDAGGIVAFARDGASGALTRLNSQPSGGAEPAHVAVDPTGRFAVVANYGAGNVAVFPLAADGSLGEVADVVQHLGSGPIAGRQDGPHTHHVVFDTVGEQVIVTDLGGDAVYFYDLDDEGRLSERVDERFSTEPGAGPRHVALHPDGRHLFVLNELNSTLLVLRRDASGFAQAHAASTLPSDFVGQSTAGEVRVAPSGDHVYTSNRGDLDSIAVFAFDADAGTLALQLVEPSIAACPRDFVLDGSQLLVAGQDNSTIVTFEVDESAPSLTFTGSVDAPTPVCLLVL